MQANGPATVGGEGQQQPANEKFDGEPEFLAAESTLLALLRQTAPKLVTG